VVPAFAYITILHCFSVKLTDDQIDGTQSLYSLIQRLKNDIGQIALLGGCDLELLSDMDPDSLVDMAFDRYRKINHSTIILFYLNYK